MVIAQNGLQFIAYWGQSGAGRGDRDLKQILKWLGLAGLVWFGAHVVVLMVAGFADEGAKAGVMVIYGNRVGPDGQPGVVLKARLDKGLALYRAGRAPLIVVSGGTGVEGFDEADVMKKYLVARGVPPAAIVSDGRGNNSYLTAKNLKAIAKSRKIGSVLIVSHYYHILRARLALRRFGFDSVASAPANDFAEWRDLYSVPREVIGYYWYLVRPYS